MSIPVSKADRVVKAHFVGMVNFLGQLELGSAIACSGFLEAEIRFNIAKIPIRALH